MSLGPTYADVEIRILGKQKGGYPVEMTVNSEQEFPRGYLSADFLPWIPSASPLNDGQRLFEWLVADDAIKRAWAEVRGQHSQRRIRLRIDAAAPELHAIPWELMREVDGGSLAQDLAAADSTPLSRYLAGQWQPGSPILKCPVRMLVAVASPGNLEEHGWSTIDVEAEWALLREAMEGLEIKLVQLPQPCTLHAVEEELRKGYHILHLVAHGKYDEGTGQAFFYLADEDGQVQGVHETEFAEMVARQLAGTDKRRRATWFELAHDRLVQPVRADNAAWRVAHLSPLQQQAALWQDEERADRFLLGGEALEEAEDWAKTHRGVMTEVERDFLDGCKNAQRLQEARRVRSRWVLVGAAILLVAFAALAFFGWDQARQAQNAYHEAENAQAAAATNEWYAGDIVKTAALAQKTSEAGFLTAVVAQQNSEAAQAGLVSASTAVARSQALARTIEALEAADQALAAEMTPASLTATAPAEAATVQAIQTQLAQVGATQTALVEARQTSVVQATQTSDAQAIQTAIARATQTAMVEATQTAMAESRYCYVGGLTRPENIGPPSISIWGRVLDRNGGGIGGVLVRVENDWGWFVDQRTQPKGWFRVDGLTEPIIWTVRLPDYGAFMKVKITDYGQRAIVTFEEKPCP